MNTSPSASSVTVKPAANEVEKGQLSQRHVAPAKGGQCDRVAQRQDSQQTKFALVLVANLLAIGALLLLWNFNALTDKNIAVAALIVAGMVGVSALCCVSLFVAARFASSRTCEEIRKSGPIGDDKKLGSMFKQHRRKFMLRAGMRKNGGPFAIQTVCPTPEFQYFPQSAMQPCGDERTISQSESHLSTGAFSLLSTLPASSLDSQTSGLRNGGAGLGFVLNRDKLPYASDSSPRSTSSTSASEMHHLMLPTTTAAGYAAATHYQLGTNSALHCATSSCLPTTNPGNSHMGTGVFMPPPRMYTLV